MKCLAALSWVLLGLSGCCPRPQAGQPEPSPTQPTPPIALPKVEADLLARAEQAWQGREDREQLTTAIELWEQVLGWRPNNTEILTRLSRAYYFLADSFYSDVGSEAQMLESFERGLVAGQRAMMASSSTFAAAVQEGTKVEEAVAAVPASAQGAIFWYAANLGQYALAKGLPAAVYYKDRIYCVMQRVLEIDETYFHAAPHRYFGGYYAEAPLFAGGNLDKSKTHFERALELDSQLLATKVAYAKHYAPKVEDRELFERLLKEVTEADPNVIPELVPEQKLEQRRAKKLLSEIEEYF